MGWSANEYHPPPPPPALVCTDPSSNASFLPFWSYCLALASVVLEVAGRVVAHLDVGGQRVRPSPDSDPLRCLALLTLCTQLLMGKRNWCRVKCRGEE